MVLFFLMENLLVLVFIGFFFLFGCVSSTVQSPTVTACTELSGCKLVNTGSGGCPVCDKGNDSWVCQSNSEISFAQSIAKAINSVTGFAALVSGENNCACPAQEFEYSCRCELGKCEKFVSGTNPSFCRQAANCEGKGLIHPECVGSWSCEANSCVWICSGFNENGQAGSGEGEQPEEVEGVVQELTECRFDEKCFREALASCSKATFETKNTFFRAGILVSTVIEKEIIGPTEDGLCETIETETGSAGNIKVNRCLYDGTSLEQCRIESNTG